MKKLQLPYLQNLLYKGLFTFVKGVKIGSDDISISQEFEPILIDKSNLKKYKLLFGFENQLPLTYLYLIAQRAQISLMLDKSFTIAIPGLIHVSNRLELINEIDVNEELELKSTVFVEANKEGSLKPIFNVEFYQKEKLIAKCESVYIAKRTVSADRLKSNSIKKKKIDVELLNNPSNLQKWKIAKNDAKKYAVISGDKNPIHTSVLVAKLFGFKSTIIHGWYLLSKATQAFQKSNSSLKSIKCDFLKAIVLPSEIDYLEDNNNIQLVKNDTVFVEMIVE